MSDPMTPDLALLYMPGVRSYVPHSGQQCYSAHGPNGVFLVTPSARRGDWDVWRSDSLRRAGWSQSASAGILAAVRQSGLRSIGGAS